MLLPSSLWRQFFHLDLTKQCVVFLKTRIQKLPDFSSPISRTSAARSFDVWSMHFSILPCFHPMKHLQFHTLLICTYCIGKQCWAFLECKDRTRKPKSQSTHIFLSQHNQTRQPFSHQDPSYSNQDLRYPA